MSSLKLYGSTSGYVEIVPEVTAGNNSVTLPNTTGSIAVKDASGNLEVGTGVTISSPSADTFAVSTNGSERVRVDSSGNVGIGTTIPQYNLDVLGDINFSGSLNQGGSAFVASRWTAGTGNDIYRLSGDVGIGTTNPQYSLDVLGDINFTGTFRQNGSAFVASRWTAGIGDDIYRLSGDVGIGTTNPTAKLEVVGNVVADGSDIRSLSGTHLVSYSSVSDIANSAKSITGFSTYRQVGVLTAGSNTNSGDDFGYSVAVTADGNTIFVGARKDEIGGSSNSSGAVYVFDRVGLGSSFYQVGILTGSLASNSSDYFGQSVACTPDGKTLIASAPFDESGGLMYVFDRVGNNFNQVGILSASIVNTSDENFGVSIDISADGKTIVGGYDFVSLPGYTANSGAAFVWERDGNTFTEVGILTAATPETFSQFGEAVAISGDGKTIVVGSLGESGGTGYAYGSINIFDRVGVGTTSVFNRVGVITGTKATSIDDDNFGCSVDISYDGSSIIVGDFNGDVTGVTTTGTASVYDRVGNNFNLVGIFTGSRSTRLGYFGNTVVMSPDGKRMLVTALSEGSGNEGLVYIFERQGNTISQVGIVTGYSPGITYDIGTPFDKHLGMSADGKTMVLGAPGSTVSGNASAGAAFVFDEVEQTYLYSSPTGNIGIGVTNPGQALDVSGSIRSSSQIISTQANSTTTGGGQIYLNGATGNRIDFNSNGVAAPTTTTRSAGTKIVLYPNISPSSADYGFGIEASTLWSGVSSSADQFKWYAGTTNVATLSGTGTFTTTTLVETSSITLKENINPIENALDKILQLNPVTYDRKNNISKNEAGLIAEEVNEIIPNIVSKDSEGNPNGINYTKLSVYLIDAIKELKKEIEDLRNGNS
jgi:hypothetical protein